MARFDLSQYATVAERIALFWSQHPNGAIITTDLTTEEDRQRGQWRIQAAVYFDINEQMPRGTGLAFEIDGTAGANMTAAMENAESSAIGRCLATAGYAASKNRASREEMMKVERNSTDSNAPKITAKQVQNAATLEELKQLWESATESGDATKLIDEFTAKKQALNG